MAPTGRVVANIHGAAGPALVAPMPMIWNDSH